jgi:hypothetical protein
MTKKPNVFISHVSKDEKIATRFTNWLKNQFGDDIVVFFSRDAKSFPLGAQWFKEINQALSNVDIMLVLCSHEAMQGQWIHYESAIAMHGGKKVIPLCLPGFEIRDLPAPFSQQQCYELEDPKQFDNFITALSDGTGLSKPSFVTADAIKEIRGIRSTEIISANSDIDAYRKRTIDLLKTINEVINDPNAKNPIVRQAGSLSSFAISKDEKVPGDYIQPPKANSQNASKDNYDGMTYHDLLIEEKKAFYDLVERGAKVRIIIRPSLLLARVILDKVNEEYVRKNILTRYDELISAIRAFREKPNFQIVTTYDLHHGNVQIIDKNVMFIGIKSVKDFGFSTTEKVFHPDPIRSEITYFDDLFRDNVDNIMKFNSPSPEGVFGSPDLKDKVIEQLQLIKSEIQKYCEAENKDNLPSPT